jgi:hypothetical protein
MIEFENDDEDENVKSQVFENGGEVNLKGFLKEILFFIFIKD